MAVHTPGSGASKASARKVVPTTITNAKTGTSRELASREKRYAITMGIRTACFIAMIFFNGPIRWVFLAGAVFLPYLAVLFANQANVKTSPSTKIDQGEPTTAPQLTTGPPPAEVIDGELVDDEDDNWAERDRVA